MPTIFLEFSHDSNYPELAANGTDVIFWIDGRWKADTVDDKVHQRVAELRAQQVTAGLKGQLFRGYTVSRSSGGNSRLVEMRDWDPPVWARPEVRDPRLHH